MAGIPRKPKQEGSNIWLLQGMDPKWQKTEESQIERISTFCTQIETAAEKMMY